MAEKRLSIKLRGRIMQFCRPLVMGIVNVTPDSFYSGSRSFDSSSIEDRVKKMITEGADIFDIGGYSSRPGAPEVSPQEEFDRLSRGLEIVRKLKPDAIISVDTFRAEIARKCVEQWDADIINDIGSGYLDPEMWAAVADLGVPYVLMHNRGNPQTMQGLTDYTDVAAEVVEDLAAKAARLHALGVSDVIIDPGFGFAKTVDQNYRLFAALTEIKKLGMPLLVGISHKTMLWKPLGITPDESTMPTVALDAMALMLGADILRVHEVLPAVQTVEIYDRLRRASAK